MLGLEFGGISDVPYNFENIETDLNGLNETLLRNLEKGREAFELTYAADRFRSDLQLLELNAFTSDNQNLLKKLSTLRDKSYKVKTPEQLETLKKQFEQIKSSQASLQTAKTAQAELAVKQSVSHKPIITDVSQEVTETLTDTVKSSVQTQKAPAKAVIDEAAIKAEAQARTQAQQQAAINAQNAQKFYSSLSDAATGKSAEESAKIFEETAVKAEAAVKKPITPTINNADDIVKNNKNIKETVLKVIKSKKFKYGAIAAAVIIAGTAIFTHLKKKNEKKHNLNTIK